MDINNNIKNKFWRIFRTMNKKTAKINKKAKNPFLETNFEYNPFVGAIEQTYIWIEQKNIK